MTSEHARSSTPPQLLAARAGDVQKLLELLDEACDLEATDRDGRTALHHALIGHGTEAVRELVCRGANVNAVDRNGWTPLHFAAQGYGIEETQLLLKHGAAVDAQDRFGNTPLSNAVYYSKGRGEVIALLLNAGADPDKDNFHGSSPRKLANLIASSNVSQFFS